MILAQLANRCQNAQHIVADKKIFANVKFSVFAKGVNVLIVAKPKTIIINSFIFI